MPTNHNDGTTSVSVRKIPSSEAVTYHGSGNSPFRVRLAPDGSGGLNAIIEYEFEIEPSGEHAIRIGSKDFLGSFPNERSANAAATAEFQREYETAIRVRASESFLKREIQSQ